MSDKDLFTKLRKEFEQWYEQTKQVAYYFTGKDAGNLKQLIKKIQFVGKEKHKDESNEWIIDAFRWILQNLDHWTKQNATIPIINSRFNEILANGKRVSKPHQEFTENYNAFKRN